MPPHSTVRRRRAPTGFSGLRSGRSLRLVLLAAILGLAVLGELGMRSALAPGSAGTPIGHALAVARFYAGVCALVALSLTVAAGLLATDRVLLAVRQRIWVQSAHRTLSMLAVAFLGLHVLTQIAGGRISAAAAVVPFVVGSAYVGLGAVAAYLMLLVAWTGLVRARFAGSERPWVWRALHTVAYLCWPVALLHGLRAGRPPAAWVGACYLLLMLAVLTALVVRLLGEHSRRSRHRPRLSERVVHQRAGRALVDQRAGRARPPIEMPTSELPTLVDLQIARGLRRPDTGGQHRPRHAAGDAAGGAAGGVAGGMRGTRPYRASRG